MTMTEATGPHTAQTNPAQTNAQTNPGEPYTVPQPPAAIDAAVWPSVATVPSSLKARLAGRAADAIFRAAVRRLPLEVRYPDGTVLGKAASGQAEPGQVFPVMTMNRPEAFAARLGDGGLIGLGESYMAGDWDADDLTAVMEVFAARVGTLVPEPLQKLRGLYLPRTPAHGTEHGAEHPLQHLPALRPVQRTLRDVPGQHHDVLQRALPGER